MRKNAEFGAKAGYTLGLSVGPSLMLSGKDISGLIASLLICGEELSRQRWQ
jgi:hypothetical protein